ncbi:ABC transporter permease [Sorangium sp. So ce388]|uniref:ABC transporter permease n=1 Tax=Sorangium sp. So ce388 TaxID=3133309 RepID=UPI003F5C52F5
MAAGPARGPARPRGGDAAMRLADLLHSTRAVVADRTRAALTLLGIIIGTGSIVLLASLLAGGEEALLRASQQAVEADLIQIHPAEVSVKDRRRTRRDLSRADARALDASRALGGASALSESVRDAEARAGDKKKRITLVSAAPAAPALYDLELAAGRFLTDEDLASRRRVGVVGHEVWADLFGGPPERAAEGEALHMTADGHLWTIVGVLKDRPILGSTDSTNIWNRKVLVPETTYDALFSPSHKTDRIYVRQEPILAVRSPLAALRGIIDATLQRRHHGVKNFRIEDRDSHGQEQLVLDIIKMLLLSTGVVALIVGGINIMNIMLVTVTERTREIGIRRAVGASPRAILLQFLCEAAAVSLLGGVLGVLSGVGLSWAAGAVLERMVGRWAFQVEVWSIVLGLGLSVTIGVLFGFYPAWRAARLDPIEALRTE